MCPYTGSKPHCFCHLQLSLIGGTYRCGAEHLQANKPEHFSVLYRSNSKPCTRSYKAPLSSPTIKSMVIVSAFGQRTRQMVRSSGFYSVTSFFCQAVQVVYVNKTKPEDQWSCKRSPDNWAYCKYKNKFRQI